MDTVKVFELENSHEDVEGGYENEGMETVPDCPSYNDATSLVPPPYTPRSDIPDKNDTQDDDSEPTTDDSEQSEGGEGIPVHAISIEPTGTLPAIHDSMRPKKRLWRLYAEVHGFISNAGPKSYALFGLWFIFFVYGLMLIIVALINIRNCPAYIIMPPFLAVSGFLLTPFMITLLFKPTLFEKHTKDKMSVAASVLLSAFLLNSTVQTGIPWELMNLASPEQVTGYDPSYIYLISKSSDNYGAILACDKLTYGLAFTVGIISHINILIIVLTIVLGCLLCCCCSSWFDSHPQLQIVKKN